MNTDNTITEEIKEVFENSEIRKICYNIKQNNHALINKNINTKGDNFDIMLAHYLISSEERGKLDDLSQIYLNYEMIVKQKNTELNERDYICEQADIIFQLYPLFKQRLKQDIDYLSIKRVLLYNFLCMCCIFKTGF